MAIAISVIESSKQIIAGIPEYISIAISNTTNAIVYYTFDGSAIDTTGNNPSTLIMEHVPGDPLHGTIFLPAAADFLELNMLAVGLTPNDVVEFYRRYGLDDRHIGIGRPGIKKPVEGGSGYVNTPSPNIAPDKSIIAPDGYTEGSIKSFAIKEDGYDGYIDAYGVATSGILTPIPPGTYDHIVGFITDDDGYPSTYSTTTLTPEQELGLLKLSDRGDIFVDDGNGLVGAPYLINTDPRSTTITDSTGRQIEVIPIEDYPIDGYVVDGYSIDDNFDNAPIEPTTKFTSGGVFNPRAAYIEIDGRADGYINGQPIQPGDRVILNKPFQQLRYLEKREDLGDAIRKGSGYISGGISAIIWDYEKGQAAFYYWDHHDYRWVMSLQKIQSPQFSLVSKPNGVVKGQVFRWITGKRQVLPG